MWSGGGDVRDDRLNAGRAEGLGVTLEPYPGKNLEATMGQLAPGGPSHSGGGSGHHDPSARFTKLA
ncbi:hypothetical protein GCM10010121_093970 [Streptomyces brasiliensis]|uniref:Uncharacterized protein n=1 Tax=Streptomyces brasiliensis TaxID=1954 RepID=A0A917PA95_9ACTN|nr:hypothetical protein GCM10010121_093970 [Streptomyces brasiliensis]